MFEEGLQASAGAGWEKVYFEWLPKELPYPVDPLEVIGGWELQLLDEFGIRWVFGWRESDRQRVLFGAFTQRRESADVAIDKVRIRVEGWS